MDKHLFYRSLNYCRTWLAKSTAHEGSYQFCSLVKSKFSVKLNSVDDGVGDGYEGSPIRDLSSWHIHTQHTKCQKRKPTNLSQQTNFVVLQYIGCYFNLGFAIVLRS